MQSIFIFGGWDGYQLPFHKSISVFNPDGAPVHLKSGPWPALITARDALTTAFIEGELLAMGGHDGANYLASCEIYSASSPGNGKYKCWTAIGALEGSRAFHASASVGRTAFCFGGQGSKTGPPGEYGKAVARTANVMGTAEQMNIDEGVWREAPSLPSPRTMLAGAQFGGRIYAIGGREGKFDVGEVLNSVRAWDPREPGGWQAAGPMREKRYGCAAVSLEDSLYVFGGMDGNVPLNTVEVYEPRMDTWTDSPPMYYERAFPSAVAMGNFIYVIGGHNRTDEVQEVTEWTHNTKKWRRLTLVKAHASQDDIDESRRVQRECLDEIHTLEVDGKQKEADILRKSRLPYVESRVRQASECRIPVWQGGALRDTLLGMRHSSAQTVLPQMTIELLRQRRVEEEEKANKAIARTRSEIIARMASGTTAVTGTDASRPQTGVTGAETSRPQTGVTGAETSRPQTGADTGK